MIHLVEAADFHRRVFRRIAQLKPSQSVCIEEIYNGGVTKEFDRLEI